jgi:threonine aldolase
MAANRMIDLYSDTQTRPTPAMRRAMAEAEVGDEQRGEDPTVNRLCAMAAELLGKEAAVFLPSGTMCNEIALLVHCRPGDEILADRRAHIIHFEGGGPAALAGAVLSPLDGARGVFAPEQVAAAVHPDSRYHPRTRVVAIEQTANLAGGTVWPLTAVEAVGDAARAAGLVVHMDGARLLNAVAASGVPAAAFAAPCDSTWIDLSKGLGCPVGAVLAGSAGFVAEAWRWKQRLGGAMRQAGIVAAAGVYALEHHVARLADDNANARRFAEIVAEAPGVALDLDGVQSNIVFFDVGPAGRGAAEVAAALEAEGVRIGALGPTRLRAVTHLDVSAEEVERAARLVVEALAR